MFIGILAIVQNTRKKGNDVYPRARCLTIYLTFTIYAITSIVSRSWQGRCHNLKEPSYYSQLCH